MRGESAGALGYVAEGPMWSRGFFELLRANWRQQGQVALLQGKIGDSEMLWGLWFCWV